MCSKNYEFYIFVQVRGFSLNEAIVLDAGAAYIIPGWVCIYSLLTTGRDFALTLKQ